MNSIFNKTQIAIYTIFIYIWSLIILGSFRIVLMAVNHQSFLPLNLDSLKLIFKSLLVGIRFDTVVFSYAIILPFLLFILFSFFDLKRVNYIFQKIALTLIVVFLSLYIIIYAIDIPFFSQFNNRLNSIIIHWLIHDPGFALSMTFQDPAMLIYAIYPISIIAVWFYVNKKIINKIKHSNYKFSIPGWSFSFIYILMAGLIFLGARGRTSIKSPIRIGTAYFCNNYFINQAGLSPCFTLIKSWSDAKKISKTPILTDAQTSDQTIRKLYGTENSEFKNPFTRYIEGRKDSISPNIVIVLMESMAYSHLAYFNNTKGLTPNIDSLAENSLFFTNIFTSGIHTYNGVYCTLFSFPSLYNIHTMKGSIIPKQYCISHILKERGYETMFFTTHDDQFDNMGGYVYSNDYSKTISQKNYHIKDVKSTLGVPDHVMFDRAIKEFGKLNNKNQNFYSVLLTSSNHMPHIIPDDIDFIPSGENMNEKILNYADYAIGHFLKNASDKPWFENTIFAFVGDHGAHLSPSKYDMQLDYNHVPLLIYSPKYIKSAKNNTFGNQEDIFPTLMGITGKSYLNTTIGTDLINNPKNIAHLGNDNNIAAINSEWLYIYNIDGSESLYKYNNGEIYNYINNRREIADSIRDYLLSIHQSTLNVKQKDFIRE